MSNIAKSLSLFLLLSGLIASSDIMSMQTDLIEAAKAGNIEKLQLLVNSGVDINSKDKEHGATALMVAAFFGNLDEVKFLLDNGADATIKDIDMADLLIMHLEVCCYPRMVLIKQLFWSNWLL